MNKQIVLFSLLAILLLSSCASRKSFVYLRDMEMGQKYPFDDKHEAVIRSNDRLGITVSCKNPELAIPFNIQGGNFQIDMAGNVKASETAGSKGKGYLVDVDGNIDFPILGKLHLEGLKISEVKNLIENKIKESNYIKDPLVTVEILNFKYTVLGAVGHNYNPQIQISAESETKRSIFREKDKTKRSKKESAQHSKSRNKSFVMTSVSAL